MLQKTTIEYHALELLKALQADNEFVQFHLAGGTGLALQLGHRLSVDLDLFTLNHFDSEQYLQHLEGKYQFNVDYSAVSTLKGSIGDIKVDFIAHPYKLIKPVVEIENIRLYSVADIAAMKVNAIAGNGTRSKDFVDLYFLLNHFTVQQILDFYDVKYNGRNTLHALKSLNYFNDISLSDWPVLIDKKLTWNIIKATIDKHCKEYLKSIKPPGSA
jgi:hypothetical protein